MNQFLFPFEPTLEDKAKAAIELLRQHEATAVSKKPEGYWLAFSGGKDSCVIKQLAIEAGVKCRMVYNVTTIDPPELVRFIKQYHKDVEFNLPKRNFFKSLEDSNGLPTRLTRWCCEEFKERYGEGFIKILGVRVAESFNRKKTWEPITHWRNTENDFAVNPILYWSEDDVWNFIKARKLPYCSLYDEGIKRIGCIGCPMGGTLRFKQFKRWPKYEWLWRRATKYYFDKRKGKIGRTGKPYFIEKFKTSDEFFDWWLSDDKSKNNDDEPCLGLY